jgi:hypothetical protein
MESLDTALTYAIDLAMLLGGGYIGTAFVVYMVDRWKELEVKPKQKVNIPLNLKAADTIPLELDQPELSVAAIPLEPLLEPAPERQELRIIEPVTPELSTAELSTAPELSTAELSTALEQPEPDEVEPEDAEPDEVG